MPERGQAVEDAELLLAQPLVDDELGRVRRRGRRRLGSARRSAARGGRARSARRSGARLRAVAANQRPSARDCCSPSGHSGTSTSRPAMSIAAQAGASAASRATLPALSPWRTIHSRSGQRFCIVIRPPCFMEDNAGGGQKHRRSAGVWAMIFLRSRSSRPAFKRGVIAGAAPCGPGRRSWSGLRRQVQSQASTWRCCRSALHGRFHPSCGSS